MQIVKSVLGWKGNPGKRFYKILQTLSFHTLGYFCMILVICFLIINGSGTVEGVYVKRVMHCALLKLSDGSMGSRDTWTYAQRCRYTRAAPGEVFYSG